MDTKHPWSSRLATVHPRKKAQVSCRRQTSKSAHTLQTSVGVLGCVYCDPGVPEQVWVSHYLLEGSNCRCHTLLGTTQQSIKACEGESELGASGTINVLPYIFLVVYTHSDIWALTKLETYKNIFSYSPNVLLLVVIVWL